MNDTKVYTCVCKGVNKTPAVTHADYMALEEELAAMRVRVGDVAP